MSRYLSIAGQLRRSFPSSSAPGSLASIGETSSSVGPNRRTPSRNTRLLAEKSYRTVLGTQLSHQISLEELLGNDDGGPRLTSPYFPSCADRDVRKLPLMLYVPGIDGTGLGARNQLEKLSTGFELEIFMMPLDDQRSFRDLLVIFTNYLQDVVRPLSKNRMIYVMGESFGALLALAAAKQCPDVIDRLILINPATSFASTPWFNAAQVLPSIPRGIYGPVTALVAPLVANPLEVLRRGLDGTTSISERAARIVEGGLNMLGTLEFVSDSVDADLIRSKVSAAVQGNEEVEGYLHKIPQRTMIIASENDRLLPSVSEAERLKALMLRALIKILPGKSHAVMEDDDIDLLQVLKDEGFYAVGRSMSSGDDPTNGRSFPKNNFGQADPIELPLEGELKDADKLVELSLQLTSPVFFSTESTGQIVSGLDGVPDTRPLIFVGNHTLMALDMNVLVYQILKERGFLVRGLAHPAIISDAANIVKLDKDEASMIGRLLFSNLNPRRQYKLYSTFGAVPVTPKNTYKLLSEGERILLYPGGAVEALKYRDQKYEVMWPDRPEFVRMGAKFGATVVTIASVGVEDAVHQLLDVGDMLNSPVMGPPLKSMARSQPKARPGRMAIADANDEILAPPLFFPIKPSRQYFLFGKPVQLTPDLLKDDEKTKQLYNKFKIELETNISYLIEKREDDPYKEFEKRMMYEAINGKQAPSFVPDLVDDRS